MDGRGLSRTKDQFQNAGRWRTKVGDSRAIPIPIEVRRDYETVPRGRIITINQIRTAFTRKHGATIGCPITTDFSTYWNRSIKGGREVITLYWRSLKAGGMMEERDLGGEGAQKKFLEEEDM